MMAVLTEEQKLLTSYLAATGMSLVERMLVTGMLWEEEATIEMLLHISKTQESDPAKLYSIAYEISQKHKSEETEKTEEGKKYSLPENPTAEQIVRQGTKTGD